MSAEVAGFMVVGPDGEPHLFKDGMVAYRYADEAGLQVEPLVRAISLIGAVDRLGDMRVEVLTLNLEIAKRDHRIAKLEGAVETLEDIRGAACA